MSSIMLPSKPPSLSYTAFGLSTTDHFLRSIAAVALVLLQNSNFRHIGRLILNLQKVEPIDELYPISSFNIEFHCGPLHLQAIRMATVPYSTIVEQQGRSPQSRIPVDIVYAVDFPHTGIRSLRGMTCSVSDTHLVLDTGGYASLLVHHLKYRGSWTMAKLCDDVDLNKALMLSVLFCPFCLFVCLFVSVSSVLGDFFSPFMHGRYSAPTPPPPY